LLHNAGNVSNAVEALRIMNGWDKKKSRKAVKVCSAAMEGLASLDEARAAFERAAEATGNLMPRV
jgi:hypothetical protein